MAEANLPIDSKSLPSRIFYSEDEYKLYVGKPGEYFEIGIGDFIPVSEKAEPNGVATLDGGGKIPATQLPNSVMTLEGEWNADTNTPTLTNGTGNAGMVYEVTTAGTTDFGDGDITFAIGDWAVYGADEKWYKSLNSNEVTSVNGKTGTVVLTQEDILPSETGKFLVGGATDWEKRGVTGHDMGINQTSASRVPYWNATTQAWVSGGMQVSIAPISGTIGARKSGTGAMEVGTASDINDAVPLGQLNTFLEDYIQEPTTDGTSGQVLTTDGSGGRSWTTPAGGITALTGDVTASGSGSVVATIADNAVTPEKLSEKDYVRYAEAGITWTSANAVENNIWNSVTYGDGKFVAVCGSAVGTNRIMYSTDGINWTSASAPENNNWYSVTYGDGKFVAVASAGSGTNRVMYSTDGINWLPASATQNNIWFTVTYGDGKFVAISQNGTHRVMYSTDGINWLPASATQANQWNSVTYGNGKFVAVSSGGTNRVMYSTNGINWTSASATEANAWRSVTYGNGKFVAVSTSGANQVMYSTDGITWNSASAAEANQWQSVTYGDGKFVAVSSGGTNRVMYSTNGINWTSASAAEANSWGSVTYGNGKFVAVSSGGTNRVMYSEGGLNFGIPTSALINDGDGDSPFITEAPSDGKQYGRKDGQWEEVLINQDLQSVLSNGNETDINIVTKAGVWISPKETTPSQHYALFMYHPSTPEYNSYPKGGAFGISFMPDGRLAWSNYLYGTNNFGSDNTPYGFFALENLTKENIGSGASILSRGNLAVGNQSMRYFQIGNRNTVVGGYAGRSFTNGNNNTLVGYSAGASGTNTLTNNTIIGNFRLPAGTTELSDNIIISTGVDTEAFPGGVGFRVYGDGTTVIPKQTQTTYNNESTGKAIVTKEILNNALNDKLDNAPDGTNNLIDVDNKLNPVYLPPNIMHLQGEWNADTNTPTLSNGTGVAGYIYEVTTAGTTDFGDGDIEFALGDWVVYGGDGKWYKSPNTGEVVGVKGDNESNYRKGLVNIDIDDIVEPTANQFLVGNSAGTDWEKRGITGSDFGLSGSGYRMARWSSASNNWSSLVVTNTPTQSAIAQWSTGGVMKANNAIESNDLVPLGQLEGMLTADNIDYDNTASGLLAETVQEAVDELVENIVNSNIKEVDGNYTILDTDRGKTIFILGNDRVITLPNTLTDKFSVTIKCMGTGATLVDSNGIIVGIPTAYISPYNIPEFGVICLTKITSGIDLTGDVL